MVDWFSSKQTFKAFIVFYIIIFSKVITRQQPGAFNVAVITACLAFQHLILPSPIIITLALLARSMSSSSGWNTDTLIIISICILFNCVTLWVIGLADFTKWFLVLIHPAIIAKWEVLWELKIIGQSLSNWVKKLGCAWFVMSLRVKERMSPTLFAFEALLTLPLAFWNGL